MTRVLLLGVAALLAGSPAQAKPASLNYVAGPPGLPAGSTFAVVSGNPGKKGMFTIRARLPANYAVPAHSHPTAETVSVVSGKLAYGMSDRMDRASAQGLNPGDRVVMKPRMNHWVYTGDGAEIEVRAMGPFKIIYANPADDPRRR